MLFSKIVVYAIEILVCLLFAGILFRPLFESAEFLSLKTTIGSFAQDVLHGDFVGVEFSESLASSITGVFGWLHNEPRKLIGVIVAIFAVMEVCRFVVGVFDYVMAVNVHEHMTCLRHAKFFTTLVEHFKPACKYGLYCIIGLTLYNVVIYSLAILIAIGAIKVVGVFGVTITLFFLIFSDSFRLTMVGVVPAKMASEGCNVRTALRYALSGLKFKEMVDRFISYFVMNIFKISATILSAFTTCGIALLITVPLFSVTNMAIRFVDYFTIKRLKYYCTYDDIIVPKELRSPEEQLLNQVDIDA